jgi:pimeloyl-ACP methyl ester carboxylesterase
VPLAAIQKLTRYWMTDYGWRTCEANLNALPQFITEIDGLDIHFIHVRSQHEDALPLIVNGGWFGSIIEQLKIIDRLTDPTAHGASAADAFHVVIPSMPGYGFSGNRRAPVGARAHGPSLGRTDEAPRLQPLRRPRRRLGCVRRRPDGLAGTCGIARPSTPNMPATVPADVGQALQAGDPPPSGVFPGEQYHAPCSWAEQAYPNLIYFNKVDRGGHFAAWEQPQLFADELRAAFRSLR